MRRHTLGISAVTLLVASYLTLPRLDVIAPSALFYVQNLRPLYYLNRPSSSNPAAATSRTLACCS